MNGKIKMCYKDVLEHRGQLIDYALHNSDMFSIITHRPKKCADGQLAEMLKAALEKMEEYSVKHIMGIRKWCSNNSKDNRTDMRIYRSDKKVKPMLLDLNCLEYSQSTNAPEDLCFYRNKAIWISTVRHEQLAFMYYPTDSDFSFLEHCKIAYGYNSFDEIFRLQI